MPIERLFEYTKSVPQNCCSSQVIRSE